MTEKKCRKNPYVKEMGATPAIFYLTEHIIRDKVKFSLHVNGFNQLNRPKLLCKKGATLSS